MAIGDHSVNEVALIQYEQYDVDASDFAFTLAPVPNSAETEKFARRLLPAALSRVPETLDARGPVQFSQIIECRSREIIERVEGQLADDESDPEDVTPTSLARLTCSKWIRKIAPRVALASRLKVAAFTEDSSGVSLVLQSLLTDRRVNIRIGPDGRVLGAICTDEHMDVRTRPDEPDLPRELAEWVTSRT
jgi:hypothetical protein